mmetsp:Transcript_24679/g.58748  ORF Transcript_24679/g.58748 Transcript_24679/m.58748 type:complete len:90 (+) Transcript_24679:958-1227(+)
MSDKNREILLKLLVPQKNSKSDFAVNLGVYRTRTSEPNSSAAFRPFSSIDSVLHLELSWYLKNKIQRQFYVVSELFLAVFLHVFDISLL